MRLKTMQRLPRIHREYLHSKRMAACVRSRERCQGQIKQGLCQPVAIRRYFVKKYFNQYLTSYSGAVEAARYVKRLSGAAHRLSGKYDQVVDCYDGKPCRQKATIVTARTPPYLLLAPFIGHCETLVAACHALSGTALLPGTRGSRRKRTITLTLQAFALSLLAFLQCALS